MESLRTSRLGRQLPHGPKRDERGKWIQLTQVQSEENRLALSERPISMEIGLELVKKTKLDPELNLKLRKHKLHQFPYEQS